MIAFTIKGAIFDVDDTLLDNKPGIPSMGLHARSRLAAVQTVGKAKGIEELANISVEDNLESFVSASAHTIEAAVWNMFVRAGLRQNVEINHTDPLLIEIVELKEKLHEDLLINEAEEVAGAIDFVRSLVEYGLGDKLAIASTATRRDVDLFFAKTGLSKYFPDKRIKTKESVTHHKPDPEVFNAAFETLGLPESDRAQVYAFEDDPRGILAAKNAGLYVCAITTRFTKDALLALEVPPDVVAESYAEFKELFGLAS